MRMVIPCVEAHTCGEPTRIVVGGFPNLPGDSMLEKQAYFREHLDHIRKALIFEPRGHRGMFGAILTPPVNRHAVCGVIWFDNRGYLSGCGHGTIAVGTVLVETGAVRVLNGPVSFALDTPAGTLPVTVEVGDGRVCEVSFENVPAFTLGSDIEVEVPELGRVTVDIAFGGNFFAILEVSQLGLEIRPSVVSTLAEVGLKIRDAVNREVKVVHPLLPEVDHVQIVTFVSKPTRPDAQYLLTHMFANGAIDRSPGGTGTSALMAALHAKGLLAIGDEIVTEGIAGGIFRGRLLREVKVGNRVGVVPRVAGSAYITAFHQFILDSNDPWAEGFEVG
jgi:proline racemase